jgi:hypothetical protein
MRNGICLNCAAALHVDEHTGELVDQWGEPICGASYRLHQPDVPPSRTVLFRREERPERRQLQERGTAAQNTADRFPRSGAGAYRRRLPQVKDASRRLRRPTLRAAP